MTEVIGTRIQNKPDGFLYADDLTKPASYGRATVAKYISSPVCWWQIRCPDGSGGSLNPDVHTVTEHEDGTITVSPSIVTHSWHGFLTRGVFRNV